MPITKPEDDYGNEPDDQHSTIAEKGEESESAGGTEMLPKAILMGKPVEVGDRVTLEVTAVYDDEIAVKYPEGGEEKETPEPEEEMPGEEAGEVAVAPPPEATLYE